MKKKSVLYVVIPCHNEFLVLEETTERLTNKINHLIGENLISEKSRVLYVDDGSKDDTWELVKKIHSDYKMFCGLKLSRNKGQQNAILAGLELSTKYADIMITMDADLQDDINAMDNFIKEYYNGNEIVYGVRSTRNTDSFLKKNTSLLFYKLLSKIGVESIYNHCEYRLMTKRVVECLLEFKEVNLFLRGLVPLIGYNYTIVKYPRDSRYAGKTNYHFKQLWNLACDAITSFSIKPIRFIFGLGIFFISISMLGLLLLLILYLCNKTFSYWWIVLSLCLWGLGIIETSIGVIGEYIGKMYIEVKKRPRFFIEEELL